MSDEKKETEEMISLMRSEKEVRARYDELVSLRFKRGAEVKAGALEILEWVLGSDDHMTMEKIKAFILSTVERLMKEDDECARLGVPLVKIKSECKKKDIAEDVAVVTVDRLVRGNDLYIAGTPWRYKCTRRSEG